MSATAIRLASPRVIWTAMAVPACAAVLALTGCERMGQRPDSSGELDWARAALERNPQLELVASDPQTRVFTVRNRVTGEIQALELEELAAAPVVQLQAAAAQPSASAAQTEIAAAATAQSQPDRGGVTQPDAAPTPSEPARPESREQTVYGPQPPTAAGATSLSSTEGRYKIERTNGQLRVSGPGVSIVSSTDTAPSAPTGEGGRARAEPVICEGPRMMHLDSRDIHVEGDAIVARGGCELFVTNSRIVASGTAIVVEDAVVHISNSHIEGANGSYAASDRARMIVRGSTFYGVPRRTELALVQDQGGNRWR